MSSIDSADPDVYLGQFLDDKFFIDRHIGRGAFATVFHAHSANNTPVAIKILHTTESLAHLRFIREIKVMQSLPQSPYLVEYIDHGKLPHGGAYLAMEYVDGPTLRDKMLEGTMSPDQACVIAYQIALALQPLHRYGIVHRDLKPGNVLMAPDGTMKLFDFGLVLDSEGMLKLFEEEDFLQGRAFSEDVEAGVIVGTPEYMSVEQFQDAALDNAQLRQTSQSSDIFSLGVILYRMICGRYPFPMRARGKRPTKKEFLEYFIMRSKLGVRDVPRPKGIDDALWSILQRSVGAVVDKRQPDGNSFAEEMAGYIESGKGTIEVRAAETVLVPRAEVLAHLHDIIDEDSQEIATDEITLPNARLFRSETSPDFEPFPDVDDPSMKTQEFDLEDSLVVESKSSAPLPDPFDDDVDKQG